MKLNFTSILHMKQLQHKVIKGLILQRDFNVVMLLSRFYSWKVDF